MRRIPVFISLLILALLFGSFGGTAQISAPERPAVLKIQLSNEAITPVTARFIIRAIRQAEEQRASALVIVLDTPGGLVDSTREIVSGILHSKVPVVVYVAPAGSRAASAGVFITMSAHVAAMAPGTTIGAAHPVQIGGLPGSPPQQPSQPPAERQTDEKKDDKTQPRVTTPMEDKIVNDTVAWARALAEMRGRNADWAARAVKESVSVPASEAVKENAVDFIAEDINDLLAKLEGREVNLIAGKVKLQVAGAELRSQEMWWGERVLALLANPTLAFLLLIFGFYGILFELYTPGWGVGGTVGIICLVLGFFAMSVLPINYVGLALIAIALALFVAEAFVTSFGFLTLGGVICLILGGVMLVDSPAGFMRIPLWTLIPVALATAAITFFLAGSILKAHRAPLLTGSETISGTKAVADEAFVAAGELYTGLARTHGELWKAVSTTPIAAGDKLIVESREGLTLRVRPDLRQSAEITPINKESSTTSRKEAKL
jgi:membrane-bound serine protease (ClpP class)